MAADNLGLTNCYSQWLSCYDSELFALDIDEEHGPDNVTDAENVESTTFSNPLVEDCISIGQLEVCSTQELGSKDIFQEESSHKTDRISRETNEKLNHINHHPSTCAAVLSANYDVNISETAAEISEHGILERYELSVPDSRRRVEMAAFELLVESETPDTELTCRTGEAGGHKTGRRDSGEIGEEKSRTYNVAKQVEQDGPLECHSLSYTSRKLLPLKHYHNEARAMKDIQKFLSNPIILFRIETSTVHDIVAEMITKLSSEKPHLKLKTENIIASLVEDRSDYKLMEIMQGMKTNDRGECQTEPSFVTILCSSNEVTENHVVMCLVDNPVNLGHGAEEIHFIALVLSPLKEKKIKCALEVARTYSTLLADVKLRHQLKGATNPTEFAHIFELEVHRIYTEERASEEKSIDHHQDLGDNKKWCFGYDLLNDIRRRAPHYLSDFTEGMKTCAGIQKITSTIIFLFFSLIIPCIAFGVLFSSLTHGIIDVRKVILSQALSGLLFSIFGGQHLLVIRTTIPLTIFTKVIYSISDENEMDFHTFYALSGLWTSLFLAVSSLTGLSNLMRYCSRSTEEIFALFVSIAFTVDAIKFIADEFDYHFCFDSEECSAAKSLLSLLLLLGTVLIGCEIYNFRYSPYLTAAKRSLVADYALPVAVLLMAFTGSWVFRKVEMGTFHDDNPTNFVFEEWGELTTGMIFGSMGIGFMQGLLIFMDQNIAASVINSPSYRLKKGPAYHLDIMVVAIINAIMSVFGLPLVHGALPHSPLHVRALADVEEQCDHGHVSEIIVDVKETRVTTFVCHILIWISALFLIPKPLNYIPIPVLYGLFVFLAIVALDDLELWERLLLVFTEQNSYPPTHYIRKVPQKMVHYFTLVQLIQLAVLCAVSFSGYPYLKMLFPAFLALMIPIRLKLVPKLIREQYLEALDGQ